MVKNPPANVRGIKDVGSIPGSGRSPGEGNGNPLQYSCLENPVDRGAWRATVHGAAESDMTEQLSRRTHTRGEAELLFSCPNTGFTGCPLNMTHRSTQVLGESPQTGCHLGEVGD